MDGPCRPAGGAEEVRVQVQLEFDPALKVDANEIAQLWAEDPEASKLLGGPPIVRRERVDSYDLPTVIELVVIPLAVNVASTVLIDLATRLYGKYRPGHRADVKAVELAEEGQRALIVKGSADADAEPQA
jgi:hypothetical protein